MQKRYWLILILLLFFLLLPFVAFLGSKFLVTESISSLHITPTTTISLSPTIPLPNGIPITPLTVAYTIVNKHIILQYKHVFYDQNGGLHGDPVKVVLEHPENYHWYGLINGPDNHGNPIPLDDIFSFKVAPNLRDFLFIMQHDNYIEASGSAGQSYTVYYYNSHSASSSAAQLLTYKNFYTPTKKLSDQDYTVPRIDQFSGDGMYVSFALSRCADCTQHQPQYVLYNLATSTQRDIGAVYNFGWLNNGAYQYKDYILVDCPPSAGTSTVDEECSQDPENLPLKVGQY